MLLAGMQKFFNRVNRQDFFCLLRNDRPLNIGAWILRYDMFADGVIEKSVDVYQLAANRLGRPFGVTIAPSLDVRRGDAADGF